MKIFVSSDMEGTAGVCHWDEVSKGQDLYEHFARRMSREVVFWLRSNWRADGRV